MESLDLRRFEFEKGTVRVFGSKPREIWVHYTSKKFTIHTLLNGIDRSKVPEGTKVYSLMDRAATCQPVCGVYLPGTGVIVDNIETYGEYFSAEDIVSIRNKLSSGPDCQE